MALKQSSLKITLNELKPEKKTARIIALKKHKSSTIKIASRTKRKRIGTNLRIAQKGREEENFRGRISDQK